MDHDITPQLRSWLQETIGTIPDPVHLYPAVVADAHAAPRRTGWLRRLLPTATNVPSVGATKPAAAAIVALFGGLLLAGALTQPRGDEMVPAAATDTPSPTMTEELLSGLVTEGVEPGILRVVRDDAGHELASLGVFEIAVGPGGAVWMNGSSGLFRLREPGIADSQPNGLRTGLTVSPDGSVWSVGAWQRRDRSVRSFDGQRWVYHPGPKAVGKLRNDQLGPSFAIGPDGSVWGVWEDAGRRQPPGFELARLEGGQWVGVDLTGWPDDLIGEANAAYGPGLVATEDGSLWMIAYYSEGEDWRPVLMRYDGTRWDVVETPFDPRWFAGRPDGSWVLVDDNVGTHDGETRIARFVEGAWSESRVQLPDATVYWAEDSLRPILASDGAVWLRVNLPDRAGGRQDVFPEGCDGVARVVGSTWTHHLAGTCVWDMAPGLNGEVWVATWGGPADVQQPGDVYVITPEAVLANE